MSIDIRPPNIQGSDHEMLLAIRSYLFQLREQLQYGFDDLEKNGVSGGGGVTNNTTTVINQGSTGGGEVRPPSEAEAELTFNAIKSFIIKSADIVESYYQKIDSMLISSGTYVAKADFESYAKDADDKYVGKAGYDTYIAQVEQELQTNNTNITLVQSQTEAVGKDLGERLDTEIGAVQDQINANAEVYGSTDKYAMIRKSQGYIKAGFLDEDEYGIEVGLTVDEDGKTDKSIGRFSSKRVALYDQNGNEGAELTNSTLSANNLVVGKKQQTGNFVDIVDANGNIITKWVGERTG